MCERSEIAGVQLSFVPLQEIFFLDFLNLDKKIYITVNNMRWNEQINSNKRGQVDKTWHLNCYLQFNTSSKRTNILCSAVLLFEVNIHKCPVLCFEDICSQYQKYF